MNDLNAHDLVEKLHSGEITSEECTSSFLQAISARDEQVKAYLLVNRDKALERAREIDQRRKKGKPIGALAGLPVAVKDNLCVKGQRTTCASKILDNFIAPYDAHVVTQLMNADAVILGKTNLDEFAMGSTGENSGFHVTTNPWSAKHVPGGSSSGSAAAIAAGEAPISLGSDTGGSIRLPAAFCGVTGLKTTYGRVSRYGLVAFGSSLDQVGPLGRTVADVAMMLHVIAGHDKRDSTSVDQTPPNYLDKLNQPLDALTIGLPQEFFGEGIDDEIEKAVKEAVEVYKNLGAKIVELSMPHLKSSVATYYIVAPAEASSNLARYDGVHYGHRSDHAENLIDMYTHSRGEGFGKEVKRRIMLGTYVLSSGYIDAYYLKALKVRRLIKNEFDEAFKQCDVLLSPTSPAPAFKIGEAANDPLTMYLLDICTLGCSLADIPAVSLPCGFTSGGLPIGLQIAAPAFEEEKLLRVAQMFEGETDWYRKRAAH